jgi:hypothetical protein
MHVEDMQMLPTRECDNQVLQRPIPDKGNRGTVRWNGSMAAELERFNETMPKVVFLKNREPR